MQEEGNNGFLLRLEDETDPVRRSIAFNSKEFPLAARQPTLEYCYEEPVDVVEVSRELLSLTISPNPTSGEVWVTFSEALEGPVDLYFYDASGKRINNHAIAKGTKRYDVRLGNSGAGVYLFEFRQAGKVVGLETVVKME